MIKLKGTGLVFLAVMFFSCSSEKKGPFFGNGLHNGWADQNSVVIWTRLTKNPEINRTGPKFIVPTSQEHRRLDKLANSDSIYKAQIPEGFTLEQMEGACPGMSGEVKLVCYPMKNPEARIEKQWSSVDEDKNYTSQWKLDGLNPDTKYVIELEARKNENSEVTASVSGSFRTPPDPDSVRAINFCIVTCHDYPRRDDSINGHKIYKSMMQPFPDFLVHTGDEIREFLQHFDNVYICNGDRHWQYVTNIPGTTLWEFGTGAGSDSHAEGWNQEDVRPEHRFLRVKGGYLRGNIYRADNKVIIKFQHCDVDGKVVHEEGFYKMI